MGLDRIYSIIPFLSKPKNSKRVQIDTSSSETNRTNDKESGTMKCGKPEECSESSKCMKAAFPSDTITRTQEGGSDLSMEIVQGSISKISAIYNYLTGDKKKAKEKYEYERNRRWEEEEKQRRESEKKFRKEEQAEKKEWEKRHQRYEKELYERKIKLQEHGIKLMEMKIGHESELHKLVKGDILHQRSLNEDLYLLEHDLYSERYFFARYKEWLIVFLGFMIILYVVLLIFRNLTSYNYFTPLL